jgi:hypothetical protein
MGMLASIHSCFCISALIRHHSLVIPGGLTLERDLLRESNPMAGSFSAYHAFTLIAKRDIVAGEELFVDKTRDSLVPHPLFQVMPTAEHYEKADEIVHELASSGMDLTQAQWTDVLYRIKEEIMSSISVPNDKQVASLLPNSYLELQRAWEVGTARSVLRDDHQSGLDWIQSNGTYVIMFGFGQMKKWTHHFGISRFLTFGSVDYEYFYQ